MSGERMREIAEREAFDALPPNDWFEASAALFHAETGMLPPGKDDAGAHDRDDREHDWTAWKRHRARELSRQCRADRAWLLARVEELEAALGHVHETLGHDVPWLDTIRYLRAYVEGTLSPDSEP